MNVEVIKGSAKALPENRKDAIIDELLTSIFINDTYQGIGTDAIAIARQYGLISWKEQSDAEKIRERFLNAIAEKNFTKTQLAEMTGIKLSTISTWFYTENKVPSITSIIKVCRALGIEVIDIIGG